MGVAVKALLLLGLVACGVPRERASGGSFPHAEGYANAHGADALASAAACQSCHGVDEGEQVQGATPAAPSCRSCHAAFPHEAGYGTGPEHGAAWTADASACTDCHGASGERKPVESSRGQCVACHASYPHDGGWADASGHGLAVLARGGQQSCQGCHVGEVEDPGLCSSCHEQYPHPAGWGEASGHGAAVTAGQSCAETCHPSDPAGVAPRLACATCHDLFPHAEGWPDGHIQVVQLRGEAACASCHEAGSLPGGLMPVSCGASCHVEAP